MARRGNQQRNGLDRRTSKNMKKVTDVGYGNPVSKDQGKTSEVKVSSVEDLRNCHHAQGHSTDDVQKTGYCMDGNKSDKNCKSFGENSNQVPDEVQELSEPVPCENNVDDCSTPFADSSCVREETDRLHASESDSKHTLRGFNNFFNHLHLDRMFENVEFSRNVITRYLKASALSLLKTACEYLERQRPSFVALTSKLYDACDFVKLKIQLAYPVVLKWLAHFGSIILLLAMVWLDCTLRGIDSFLRMGTTSFFSVIWCSIFSVAAMVGMSKFLIVLALAAFVGVFIGLIPAILVAAISGTLFLWLYGSFWTTSLVIIVGGLFFMLSHERLTLLITTLYSVYCAWAYVGWLGLLVALNFSFISSDLLIYFLKNNMHQHQRSGGPFEQSTGMEGQPGFPSSESPSHASSSEGGPGMASTSGPESELTSEDEVIRLLNCNDHYQALGLSRFENVDVSLLKREYRKKAMLVHPDKNMGNEKAAEAFKKLQNAYEVLLDLSKRKAYDDELRREELLKCFRTFQRTSQKNRDGGFAHSGGDGEDPFGDSRRIACENCSNFHVWYHTKKSKSQARWCQDCSDFHQAKDGDGWVEQFSQPFLFGILQKVDAPTAYVCADSKIYDVTDWYICQEMRCPANTHKPSFHVNTSIVSKQYNAGKRSSSGQRSSTRTAASNEEETMTGEEFFEWLQNAVRAGMFDHANGGTSAESPSTKTGGGSGQKSGGSGSSGGNNKRKKKGKKQW